MPISTTRRAKATTPDYDAPLPETFEGCVAEGRRLLVRSNQLVDRLLAHRARKGLPPIVEGPPQLRVVAGTEA